MAKAEGKGSEEEITIDREAIQFSNMTLGIGAVSLVAAAAIGFSSGESKKFLFAYLVAFMYVLSLGLGALWFVTIQHLTNARWSVVVRRVAEVLAAQLPIIALLSLGILGPVINGNTDLYIWLDEAKVQADHLLHHKAPYLNKTFFLIRCVVYFVFWSWLSRHFLSQSLKQDKSGDESINSRLQVISAPSMIAFALTLTFCVIDFMMSLDPPWFSTVYGVYYFAGCVVSGYSLIALSLMWLQSKGKLQQSVTQEHYHDLGKMMFAFVIFWAYIGFSQFMLIWYADMPEETHWFHWRFRGDWKYVSALLLVAHFIIPFFGLLSRHVKRNKKALAFWAVWLLVIHYVDLFWLVYPNGSEEVPFTIVDLLCLVGVVGLFIGSAARRAKGINLIPTRDPRLKDSLAFENI